MCGYRPESLEPVGLELQPLPAGVGAENQTQVLNQSSTNSSLPSHPSGPKSRLTFIGKSVGRPSVSLHLSSSTVSPLSTLLGMQ